METKSFEMKHFDLKQDLKKKTCCFPSPPKVPVSNHCARALIYISFFLDLHGNIFINCHQMQCDVGKVSSNTDLSAKLEKIASQKKAL